MFDISKHYTYQITFSKEDDEWVGTCLEFPSLSFLHDYSCKKTLYGIMDLVEDVLSDMEEKQEPFPKPISKKTT